MDRQQGFTLRVGNAPLDERQGLGRNHRRRVVGLLTSVRAEGISNTASRRVSVAARVSLSFPTSSSTPAERVAGTFRVGGKGSPLDRVTERFAGDGDVSFLVELGDGGKLAGVLGREAELALVTLDPDRVGIDEEIDFVCDQLADNGDRPRGCRSVSPSDSISTPGIS